VLSRAESASRVAAGAISVIGNAMEAGSFASVLTPADTIVHLVGTPHPSPAMGHAHVDQVADAGCRCSLDRRVNRRQIDRPELGGLARTSNTVEDLTRSQRRPDPLQEA
jgi:hypothetical protein